MHKETTSGTIKSYWGKPLKDLKTTHGNVVKGPLKFTTDPYDVYGPEKDEKAYTEQDWKDALAEIEAAKALPTPKEIVKFRNEAIKAKHRQASMLAQVVAAGCIQPTTDNDAQLRLKRTYDLALQNIPADQKDTPEKMEAAVKQARAQASAFMGIAWEDEPAEE